MPRGIRTGYRGRGWHVSLREEPGRGSGTALTSPKENPMDTTTDPQIRADVSATLAGDQRLPYPDEIAVSTYDGIVTLRGTVGSFAQRRAAVSCARRTAGVSGVYDQLHVRLLGDDRRKDAEIRGHALQRLTWDTELPGDYLDVHVKDGWVTLKGDVDFQFQSDAAFNDVAHLHGVTGVTNEIKVSEARLC
jgi:osmotically-inducible protein OsmY